jgi:hypothetical protein
MPRKKAPRWVPTYGIYRLQHKGEDALVVQLGHDDRDAPNRKEFRNANSRSIDDSHLVQAFTALAKPVVTLTQVAAFITKYGALGGLSDRLPVDFAERFGQPIVELAEAEAELFSGFGAPRMNLGGKWNLTTVTLYQRIARFVKSIIVLDRGLRSHGTIRWSSYSLKSEVREARSALEAAGFRGADPATLAAFEHTGAPTQMTEPTDDDTAIYLARHAGDDVENLLRPLVMTHDGRLSREGALDSRGKEILAKVGEWRAYWDAVDVVRRRKPASPATIAQFQKRIDTGVLESAARWLFTSAALQPELHGSVGSFRIRFAPSSALQSLALAVTQSLLRQGSGPFEVCRLCGSAYQPHVGAKGGRPRTLCDDCFSPRLAKTVSERRRRSRPVNERRKC